MKRKLIASNKLPMALAMSGILMMSAWSLQSCKDADNELLTGQPDWLGNSIYERLSNDPDGQKYTTLLRLVDDLDQKELLSHTGSRTVFAADDDAFDRWFQTNTWGVRSYEQLTNAQKNMLLNTAMVTNAYLIELLSNAAANSASSQPTKGGSMRRITATTIYDTVPMLNPADMPATAAWLPYQQKGKPIRVFKDATKRPIIHLLPEFMRVNNFTNADMEKLTNGRSKSVNVSWINGVEVTKENITCKNGYVHKVAEVIEPVDNMAEILRQHPWNMKRWSHLLDRFSAPYIPNYRDEDNNSRTCLSEFQRIYNTTDTVYALRYFSDRSMNGGSNNVLPDNVTSPAATLIFDPGWNQYVYDRDGYDYHNDAGAMLVPRSDVLDQWFSSNPDAGGKDIYDRFGSWDNVPDDILADLLNNCMLDNFVSSIPSKFNSIVDESQVPVNIKPDDVDSCFVGCNGVVYLTNKVFAPSSFSAVTFPAKLNNQTLNVINWAIENLKGGALKSILTSMEAYYSLLLPTNNAMLTYIDPTLYGSNSGMLYEFYYDEDVTVPVSQKVKARRYVLNYSGGTVTRDYAPMTSDAPQTVIEDRLYDLLTQLIIVDTLNANQDYYKTQAGTLVRIENFDQEGTMTVEGGYQLETNPVIDFSGGGSLDNTQPCIVDKVFTKGNGKSYRLADCLPLSSTNSVYSLLKDNPEFSEFYKLVTAGKLFTTSIAGMDNVKPNNAHQNMSLFTTYNYTVYVPTNAVIQDLQTRGYLPSSSDMSNLTEWGDKGTQALEAMREIIANFVRYHVQDNSVAVGGKPVTNQDFESSMVNPENFRYFPLTVTAKKDGMTVTGQVYMDPATGQAMKDAAGNLVQKPLDIDTQTQNAKGKHFYNMMAREFWNNGASTTSITKTSYNSNTAVVHLLKDGALLYSESQLTNWKDVVKAKLGIQ